MILKTTGSPQKEAVKLIELVDKVEQGMKVTIRKEFDNCIFDYDARACIKVAKFFDYHDMAEEMENDLYIETL